MKPQSRPRCPVCWGAGTILHPFTDLEEACGYCDLVGFDPYWLGPDSAPSPDVDEC